MAFFIGIGGPWLVLAVLDLMAHRRKTELTVLTGAEPAPASHSAYLTPEVR
ncbi:hypothetical protein [Methylobacterium nigriterrae]|uniref:hypothetical protein n=1 Tax=Methylobacterium nigriterrae TaxID=3127512 RepID=UPI003013F71E